MQTLRKGTLLADSGASKSVDVIYTVHRPANAPKSILVRFWRFWRRLVRRRQDSAEVRRLRRVILDQDDRIKVDLGNMRTALEASEERGRQMQELAIPKLEHQLEVEKAYSLGLATMLEKLRSQYEADVAANMFRVARGRVSENEAKKISRDE